MEKHIRIGSEYSTKLLTFLSTFFILSVLTTMFNLGLALVGALVSAFANEVVIQIRKRDWFCLNLWVAMLSAMIYLIMVQAV